MQPDFSKNQRAGLSVRTKLRSGANYHPWPTNPATGERLGDMTFDQYDQWLCKFWVDQDVNGLVSSCKADNAQKASWATKRDCDWEANNWRKGYYAACDSSHPITDL